MGLGSVLNTARDALTAQSYGLTGTGQNIANSPFGSLRQVLPGREGQVGLRLEF